jgi:hypothetical protein
MVEKLYLSHLMQLLKDLETEKDEEKYWLRDMPCM